MLKSRLCKGAAELLIIRQLIQMSCYIPHNLQSRVNINFKTALFVHNGCVSAMVQGNDG